MYYKIGENGDLIITTDPNGAYGKLITVKPERVSGKVAIPDGYEVVGDAICNKWKYIDAAPSQEEIDLEENKQALREADVTDIDNMDFFSKDKLLVNCVNVIKSTL